MDKKQIKDMNAKWKDFRLVEARHGFDLTDFKPVDIKKY